MPYLFTSESVSEGHPDKVADQISDALVDHFLAFDPNSKVACETLVTTGQVVLAGEVKSDTYIDVQSIAREVINRIGYTKSEYQFEGNSCGGLSAVHEQSPDINRGVDRGKPEEQGAGDQGMMFGFASNETSSYMPLALDLSHRLLRELAVMRRENGAIKYLRPDAKSQVTIEYSDDHTPIRIDSIVVSTQHDDFDEETKMLAKIKQDVISVLIPRVKAQLPAHIQKLFNDKIKYHVNPSKVDRSAAYATRHIAKNLVAAGVADQILVQVSYAIGVVEPMGIFVDTYGSAKVKMSDGEIAQKVSAIFDMRPGIIEQRLKLRQPMYQEAAAYGHMGRKNEVVKKKFNRPGETKEMEVELFTWEKLDYVDMVKKEFGL